MTTRTRCPACRAVVALTDVEPGDPVDCPECGAAFTAPRRVVAAAAADDEPRPAKPKKPKGAGKKRKAKAPAGGLPKPVLLGGVGLLGVGAVVAAVVLLSGGGANKDGGANAAGGADAPTPGGFVVYDTPGGGPADPGDAPPKPAEPRKAAPVVPLAAAGAEQPVDGWALRPDPPAAPPPELPADWGLPRPPGAGGSPFPVFAAMAGPFVGIDSASTGPGVPNGQTVTVVDLRTGKPAGVYGSDKNPALFTAPARMSPDGTWVVTQKIFDGRVQTPYDGVLTVRKPGGDAKPAAEVKLPGNVAWADFVAADRFAALAYDPQPALHVYTVADGKEVQTIPFTSALHPAPAPPAADIKFWYAPDRNLGAVSPGGRYVVLGGKTALAVLDLSAGKQVAEVPVGEVFQADHHRGISFRPDGAELYAVAQVQGQNDNPVRLRGWSVATGRPLFDTRLLGPQPGSGPPLAGPVPGTMILPAYPGYVVDTRAGITHGDLDFTPVRWAGPGRLLGYGARIGAPHMPLPKELPVPTKADLIGDQTLEQALRDARRNPNYPAVYTTAFDRAGFEKKSNGSLAAMAPRPAAEPGDRAGLAPAKPQPPAAWAAPPATAAASPAGLVTIPHLPTVTNGPHAAVITFDYQAVPRPQYPVTWRRYDLATGKEEGPPVQLWPWAEMTERHVSMVEQFPAPPTGLSAEGKQLAMRDPADRTRVDVWDFDGKRLGGFVPYGPGVPVEWVGFVGGRLVTAGGGRLTGWDGPAGKAVWEVEGGYTTVTAAPGGAWVAALAGDAIDLVDGATGKCLARCPCPPGKEYLAVAVSPDGKALAAARPGDGKVGRATPTRLDGRPTLVLAPAEYVVDLWDLGTGKRDSVPFGHGVFGFVNWVDGDHLFTGAGVGELIDRKAAAVVGVYGYPGRDTAWEGPQPFAGTPDGRLWAKVQGPGPRPGESVPVWRGQPFPGPAEEVDKLLFAADREFLRPVDGPLRVEVDLGTEERGRLAAPRVAAELRKRGFVIGPKGWALRISHAIEDSTQMLTSGLNDKGTPIPMVKFTWRLYAPDGGMVWETTTTARFLGQGSRFFAKSKTTNPGGFGPNAPSLRTDTFEFGGRDARAAIAAEILDRAADELAGAGGPPLAVIRAGGASKPLPLGRTLAVVTGP